MRVLALDISTSCGWALFDTMKLEVPLAAPLKPLEFGIVANPDKVRGFRSKPYPWDYYEATQALALEVHALVQKLEPEHIVIEETNGSRSRYTQKILEWIHLWVLNLACEGRKVTYVNTSDWRRTLGTTLTKDDKRQNAKVRRLKKTGDKQKLKVLGLRGRIGKKHVAIRWVFENFGLRLKMKEDDIADAICLGNAFLLGSPVCDGT